MESSAQEQITTDTPMQETAEAQTVVENAAVEAGGQDNSKIVKFASPRQEQFASMDAKESGIVPESLNADDRTVDVVWYSGASVPRIDPDTGAEYMLRLDMAGCRLDRLNSGAPVFDCHMSGLDYRSILSNKVGTKAQVGVVLKAWAKQTSGQAKLKFDEADQDAIALFGKIQSATVRNLSFGTWIYSMELEREDDGKKFYVATDWEPFEISPVTVPADFNTTFLSASQPAGASRASSPKENPMPDAVAQETGGEARLKQEQLNAAKIEGGLAERNRQTGVKAAAAPMMKYGVTEEFVNKLIESGVSVEEARTQIFAELSSISDKYKPQQQISITRDGNETRFAAMQAAMLLRYDPNFGLARMQKADGTVTSEFIKDCGPERQKNLEELGREYRGFTLLEMAREALTLAGMNPRGWSKNLIAETALSYARTPRLIEHFEGGGSGSTSDFPSILANVANKTARQAYEAYPQTFRPFCRMTTAADFKPLNRVQLSDAPALEKLNEAGEFHRANLKDTNQTYSLGTYGKIVALTRKTIINDDLQMFTRVPAIMGVAAARMESDAVWGVITSNQKMGEDDVVLFHVNHKNLLTGAGSALALAGLSTARTKMRLQTAQNKTPLNLTPRFIAVPAILETPMLQLIYPIQLASTAVTGVVPQWVQSLIPVVEPRLDTDSQTAWYLICDNSAIDTIEYCYLEGQQGVYIETRQGFEVDGVEIKVREDFAAAAIDYRGLQKNAGA